MLSALGIGRVMRHPGAAAWGRAYPGFRLQVPIDRRPTGTGNGTDIGFLATGREQVRAFHAAALAAGGTDDGPPGPRAHHGPQHHGRFVRDLDGRGIEAMAREEEDGTGR